MLGLSGLAGAKDTDIAQPSVKTVTDSQIIELEREGFKLRELVFDSNLFEVVLAPNTINKGQERLVLNKLEKLLSIKENIIWLS